VWFVRKAERVLGDDPAISRNDAIAEAPEESTPPFEGLKAIENLEDYDDCAPHALGYPLPPGRLKLATRPSLTGSPPVTKTIGTVVVAALAASTAGVWQDFFDFVPKFKLFITGNHKPQLDNVDEAMRRRLLIVPFTVQIPFEERDPDLPEKLKAEWPAILRWMIDGCLEWQRTGLAPPKIVTDATDAYFDDQDVIRQWLDDCIEDGGPFAFVRSSELFASWKHWCEERGIQPGSLKALQGTLIDRGFTQKRMTQGRGFSGLGLRRNI
jgi:hypothetical protein